MVCSWGHSLCINYFRVPMYATCQLINIGTKKWVQSLLNAFNSVTIQEGYFHQLMYQTQVIYTQNYRTFLQGLQVEFGQKEGHVSR